MNSLAPSSGHELWNTHLPHKLILKEVEGVFRYMCGDLYHTRHLYPPKLNLMMALMGIPLEQVKINFRSKEPKIDCEHSSELG